MLTSPLRLARHAESTTLPERCLNILVMIVAHFNVRFLTTFLPFLFTDLSHMRIFAATRQSESIHTSPFPTATLSFSRILSLFYFFAAQKLLFGTHILLLLQLHLPLLLEVQTLVVVCHDSRQVLSRR